MSQPLVSIIIPTFGRPHYLADAVHSALSQSYANTEIIVIDDNEAGCEEQLQTEKILQSAEFGSVTYVVNEHNMGVAASRNRAASLAKGSYLAFLDDDDAFETEKLSQQMAVMQGVDISLCGFSYTDECLQVIKVKHQPRVSSTEEFLTSKVFTQASTILVARKIFMLVGGFPENLSFREDSILVMRVLARGGHITTVNQALFKHRCHSQIRLSRQKIDFDQKAYIYSCWCDEQNKLLDQVPDMLARKLRFTREYKYFKMRRGEGINVPLREIWQLFQHGWQCHQYRKCLSILAKCF